MDANGSIAQVFDLGPKRFRTFSEMLSAGEAVDVRFASTGPIDFFFADDGQLQAVRGGRQTGVPGRRGFRSGEALFKTPRNGMLHLVVANPTGSTITVTLEAVKSPRDGYGE